MKTFTYKVILSYDGTNYYGYQKQPYLVTIQSVLERALYLITKQKIVTFAASRTDKGVHAHCQTIHFTISFVFDTIKFKKSLNKILPNDIKIVDINLTYNNFHARYHAKSKIYEYFFSKKPLDPFCCRFQVYLSDLDFDKIAEAIILCEGENNFALFTNNKNKKKSTIRKIYRAGLKETSEQYYLYFHGKSFLKQMILFLVGFLIKIGQNKKKITDFKYMLKECRGLQSSFLAPSRGLFLKKIFY
ncbi:tRNA pseudouridine(38-40) synthase TruA [Candidatus Phytoplasma pini]|uniref:tRNA pseudouridine synthase A n=1 Tax=Candidatus Phytoplasma pini TaxID=267362 RepID=A0A559KJN7_9MOLU|nr:tRNA pseudouridine(38-40) synthase TruA [Candidatus Phytoplasma pini]TVY12329.1 tRNA pseudouridine synthase A [Candidatus Phytoplasma pini]